MSIEAPVMTDRSLRDSIPGHLLIAVGYVSFSGGEIVFVIPQNPNSVGNLSNLAFAVAREISGERGRLIEFEPNGKYIKRDFVQLVRGSGNECYHDLALFYSSPSEASQDCTFYKKQRHREVVVRS